MNKIYKLASILTIMFMLNTTIVTAYSNIAVTTTIHTVTTTKLAPKTIVINSLNDYLYYANKASEGQQIEDWRTFGNFNLFYQYKIESDGDKISIKPLSTPYGVVGNRSSLVNIFNLFTMGINGGTSHMRFAEGLNIYMHPDNKQNKYVKIDYFDPVGNVKYVINAYGVAYGPRTTDKKSYGKEIKITYCTKGNMQFSILPKWIFDKYDKIAHFSDCTKPLNLDYYINLKEK